MQGNDKNEQNENDPGFLGLQGELSNSTGTEGEDWLIRRAYDKGGRK